MIEFLNHTSSLIIPFILKLNLRILPYFLVIYPLTKLVLKKDSQLAYGIWWLFILKIFIPFNLFSFEKSIPLNFTHTNMIFNEPLGVGVISMPEAIPHLSQNSFILIGFLSVLMLTMSLFIFRKISILSLIIDSVKNQDRIIASLNKISNYHFIPSGIGLYKINANFACTTGFFRKQILLPKSILSKSDSEIESVLLHELIHIKNNDSLKLDFLHLLKIIFWFNPVFHLMLREMKMLQELNCDEQVMNTKMLTKKDYGMAIINFNNIQKEPVLNPNFAKSSKTLFLRIKQLKRRKKMKTSMKLFMLFSVIMLLMVNFDLSAKSNEKFIKPIKDGRVTSQFGMRIHPISKKEMHHDGIDIGAPKGTPVYAAKSGMVIFAEFKKNYGNTVIMQHDDQKTVYTQLSKILVSKGDKVKQGTIVGEVGSSGVSTGPHLHFEIRENDKPVNPENYIDFSTK